jgi:mannose-1-phosphate guanylyltransferase
MKALILAAGKGSRLGPAAAGLPKPLVDVGGSSPLERNVAWVAQLTPSVIWINVHAAADLVRARIGDVCGAVPVRYSHEPELLGTAGAWRKLAAEWGETSLVIYGDNVMRFDLTRLLLAHRAAGAIATVALFDPAVHRNTGPGGGRVELRDGSITRFVEGGASGLINAGAYALEPSLAEELAPGFLDFGHDVLPRLAAGGRLAGHVVEEDGYCLGIDTPERLERARAMQAREMSA